MSPLEFRRFSLLGLGSFLMIGSYQSLKVLKSSVFINTVGSAYLPQAKLFSLLTFIPVILLYSILVEVFTKKQLVLSVSGFYATLGVFFSYLIAHPVIGVANTTPDKWRLMGWCFYIFLESYITIIYVLYWAFVNDVTTPESAKRGYGLLIFGSQSGALIFVILGKILSQQIPYTQSAPIIAFSSFMMLVVFALVMWMTTRVIEAENPAVLEKKGGVKKVLSASMFLDGLYVIFSRPYVMGIFGIVFFQEIFSTIFDQQLTSLVESTYALPAARQVFLYDYTVAMQALACIFGLFGTSVFHRWLGIRACLVLYPTLLGISAVIYLTNPTLGIVTIVMIIAKALNYALSQPTKEILYIPTDDAVKYKAKGWIDVFGNRFSKASGATINIIIGTTVSLIGPVTIGIALVWGIISFGVGTAFRNKTNDKTTI